MPHGNRFRSLTVPKVTDTWHITGFSISPDNGFSLIEEIMEVSLDSNDASKLDEYPCFKKIYFDSFHFFKSQVR